MPLARALVPILCTALTSLAATAQTRPMPRLPTGTVTSPPVREPPPASTQTPLLPDLVPGECPDLPSRQYQSVAVGAAVVNRSRGTALIGNELPILRFGVEGQAPRIHTTRVPLAPGATLSAVPLLFGRSGPPQTYEFVMEADPENQVREADETNNVRRCPFTITPAPAGVDLVITNVRVDAAAGRRTLVSVHGVNLGSSSAAFAAGHVLATGEMAGQPLVPARASSSVVFSPGEIIVVELYGPPPSVNMGAAPALNVALNWAGDANVSDNSRSTTMPYGPADQARDSNLQLAAECWILVPHSGGSATARLKVSNPGTVHAGIRYGAILGEFNGGGLVPASHGAIPPRSHTVLEHSLAGRPPELGAPSEIILDPASAFLSQPRTVVKCQQIMI